MNPKCIKDMVKHKKKNLVKSGETKYNQRQRNILQKQRPTTSILSHWKYAKHAKMAKHFFNPSTMFAYEMHGLQRVRLKDSNN